MDDNLKLKIESYISNSMSKKGIELFEKEIANNSDLQKEIELAKELNHFLKGEYLDNKPVDNETSNKIKTFLQSDEAKKVESTLLKVKNEYHSGNFKPKKKFNYLVAASIAVLFISVLSYFMLNQNTTQNLYANYYSVNDLPSVIKRDNNQNDLINGVTKFKTLSYKEALVEFKNYKKTTTDLNPSVYLYAGMANMELKQYDEAIIEFDKIINSNTIDKSKGIWFKALLYLKKEEINNAKEILKQITQNDFKYKEAKELLQKLK